jgi:dienelactone hydrolase
MLLRNITSYAQPNAPLAQADKPYPVIIYMPCIGSPAINSDLEEIASWGYIIAAIYPSYDVEAVAFPDGRVIALNPELRTYVAQNDRPNIYAYRARAHKIWLADAVFTLEELKKMNANNESMFHNMLDFDHVGMLGVSHGGAVAIDFCRDNALCKAGINMDGWTKTANTDQGFDKPFMFLMSQDNIEKIEPLFANMGPQAQKILIAGAEHGIFIGQPIEKWPLSAGTKRDPYEMKHEILEHMRNFFDTYLKK